MNLPNPNYNYYPNTAITLSEIAYSDLNDIPDAVAAVPDMTCLWAQGNTVAQIFIARNVVTSEIWVVIRGTNWASPTSWDKEDFDIGSGVPFITLPGFDPMLPITIPSAVEISAGAFNGMSYLCDLKDEDGNNFCNYLGYMVNNEASQVSNIYVTGHSLGGTLTPVVYLYLQYFVYGMQDDNMALWSFAGLTAGGTTFNEYIEQFLPEGIDWRIVNSLDVAPLLWTNLQAVQDIYVIPSENINLPIDTYWNNKFTKWFDEASGSGLDYAQPANSMASMPGNFNSGDSWIAEMLSQHHASTYISMVGQNFPYTAS